MAQFERYYTVAEANATLPELRELLQQIRELRDHVQVAWEAAQPVLRAAKTNGGGKEAYPYLDDMRRINARLKQLAELGVQLKDLDQGLVDFPAWREDREVFLCWREEEAEITTWHELDTGFRGRKPL
jgi:hypothetical protein